MFDWFTRKEERGVAGFQKIHDEFGKMLDAGRYAFDTAVRGFAEGRDEEAIRKELLETDSRINEAERQIRKMLVVHASVHGATEVPACLVMMSIVKDAERVGDYSKNIFHVAITAPRLPAEPFREQLLGLKQGISGVMSKCHHVYDSNDKDEARELIVEAKKLEERCENGVNELLGGMGQPGDMGPAYVLVFRYFKRIASHIRNVASSIVQPLHELDFTADITGDD